MVLSVIEIDKGRDVLQVLSRQGVVPIRLFGDMVRVIA